MQHDFFLPLAEAILAQPTAPFHEDQVREEILRQLSGLRHVQVEQDDFGNLIARYEKGNAHCRFAFAAHMDHPGYVGGEFLGGVPESYRQKNPPVQDFGRFAMWDLPAFETRDGRIYSRACDDLVGCAAIVATFQQLEAMGADACCHGIFSRAEEVGFVGAIKLARSGRIPPNVTIVSLETSSELGGPVKMGEGVIVRVGDRTSIFDGAASAGLAALAKEKSIPYQRALMQGGTCEASAYQLYGYCTAGLCVALGNYHNCGPDETIASEFVSIDDAIGMSQLCVEAALAGELPDARAALREKFEAGCEKYRELF